jgi:hypothetical protein
VYFKKTTFIGADFSSWRETVVINWDAFSVVPSLVIENSKSVLLNGKEQP